MLNSFGWKDILRPIRDGYKHLFPSPDTGPTPEERARQRELDRLKGFCYFDTFDQLDRWTEAEADPIQRSNTPLMVRPPSRVPIGKNKANILICHDSSGNYHDYENVRSIGVDEESYSCEYLQFVDTFIYFSHKLVCIPPPPWTNTLHRNGVKSLGTLLIEPQTKDSERLLQHIASSGGASKRLNFPLAKKLAAIAKHYGFDGWLVNIEKPFPSETWDTHVLGAFLEELRNNLGPSKDLIWYDALTIANKINYQNTLNQQNILFAKACGSILTNYCWTEAEARSSRKLAQPTDLPLEKVFFGIDVWAQNPSSITHPRVTYPEKGGGGTNTGIAVNKLAEVGLSAGVFAPAWSFEHFPGQGRGVEQVVWDGIALPEGLRCSCGITTQRHPPNRGSPMAQSATEFPAGSESFFYTDFSRAFAQHTEERGKILYEGKSLHSQLSAQSVLPYLARISTAEDQVESGINILSQRLEDSEEGTQLVIEVRAAVYLKHDHNEIYERWLPLFNLNMVSGPLQCRFVSRCLPSKGPWPSPKFYLKYESDIQFLDIPQGEDYTVKDVVIRYNPEGGRLQEIGVYLSAPHLGTDVARLVVFKEILIQACPSSSKAERQCSVENLKLERRGEDETKHWRLCWSYTHDKEQSQLGIPYSEMTGPFSHFRISLNGVEVGRSYALEYVVTEKLLRGVKNQDEGSMEVSIAGLAFDGTVLARCKVELELAI
ncbi:glycosyl hydrolase family 85-domain-containing protein [Lophiotrema nucula]|uniref:Glycosyl hydrolase family 85-domain-containing protein n=1 Tax=Lophiotrema nucula TaxID=690887 RepID=A0A6A5ZJG8_9PLEO|nr:glycosyl hydrolase family 85-domain-containing protein [Lophiotrema nucula]